MTTFTIDPDNNITVFAHPQDAEAAASGQSFASQDALDTLTESWPMDRFVTVWNSFAGVAGFGADLKPVKKFENRNKADGADLEGPPVSQRRRHAGGRYRRRNGQRRA